MLGGGSTVASLIIRIGSDITGAMSGLSSVNQAVQGAAGGFSGAADQMLRGGKQLTAAVTVPLVAGMGAAAVSAVSFEKEMRNIQSISQESDASLAKWANTFQTMSMDIRQTTNTATELAQGFYYVQGSGFEGAEGMKVLQAASKAASAGLTDTETAAKAIVFALNAYGYGAEEATRVSDVLFRTVDRGVVTFPELAYQIGDVLKTASLTGVGIEELGAAIVAMTKTGISPAETITALNRLLVDFLKPADDAATTAEALGFEFSTAALQSDGLFGTMQKLYEATGGNVDVMAQLFPNIRAYKAAINLATGDTGLFAQAMEDFGDETKIAGSTQRAFDVQTKSMDAQLKSFTNTLNVAKILLGNEVVPILTEFLQTCLIPLIKGFIALPSPVKKGMVGLMMLAAAIGPLLMLAGMLLKGVAAVGGVIGGLGSIVTTAGGAIVSLATGPVGLLIAAVGLMALAWNKNWFGIRDIVRKGAGWVKSLLERLGIDVDRIWESIKATSLRIWEGIVSGIRGIVGGLVSWLTNTLGSIRNAWNTLTGTAGQAATTSKPWTTGQSASEPRPKGGYQEDAAAVRGTGGGGGGGLTNNVPINVTINNPTGEPSELSIRRELALLSALGQIPRGATA